MLDTKVPMMIKLSLLKYNLRSSKPLISSPNSCSEGDVPVIMWIMGVIGDVKILDPVWSIHVGILFNDLWMEASEAVTSIMSPLKEQVTVHIVIVLLHCMRLVLVLNLDEPLWLGQQLFGEAEQFAQRLWNAMDCCQEVVISVLNMMNWKWALHHHHHWLFGNHAKFRATWRGEGWTAGCADLSMIRSSSSSSKRCPSIWNVSEGMRNGPECQVLNSKLWLGAGFSR